MKITGRSIIVTGASSGIGKSLAFQLAEYDTRLTLVGRRESLLQEVAEEVRVRGSQALVHATDLSKTSASQKLVEATIEKYGDLQVLINNAGNVRAGRLEHMTEAEILAQITLNLSVPVLLTRAALPILRANSEALIVNISSAIALVSLPFYSVYAASKAGVAQFSEALRRELFGEGINVLTVYPSATKTPMMETSNATSEHGFEYESPDDVAISIVEAISTDAISVVRGGETRRQMIEMNKNDAVSVDRLLAERKGKFEAAVRDHSSI